VEEAESNWLPTLSRLEAELHHPGVRCSRQRLEELLHPDFDEVGRSGRHYARATVIDVLTRQAQPPEVRAGNYRVVRLAPGCALLTYTSAHPDASGALGDLALRASVWLRTARGWQLRYHQGTPAADGTPSP
jgi:hypothetical protein